MHAPTEWLCCCWFVFRIPSPKRTLFLKNDLIWVSVRFSVFDARDIQEVCTPEGAKLCFSNGADEGLIKIPKYYTSPQTSDRKLVDYRYALLRLYTGVLQLLQ